MEDKVSYMIDKDEINQQKMQLVQEKLYMSF